MASKDDIEMKSKLPKTIKAKLPKSPTSDSLDEQKKLTTKHMVTEALLHLTTNNRKGVSLHAIKKYMIDSYHVDTEKINFFIKKAIKKGIETGLIVQTKGIGVTGSFRLASLKKRKEIEPEKKKKKKKKEMKEGDDKKPKKTKTTKPKEITGKDAEKNEEKPKPKKKVTIKTKPEDKTDVKTKKMEKKEKSTKKIGTEKVKEVKNKEKKTKKAKNANPQTPGKKKMNMMKRKSIGSIIKPPKMKPKAK